MVVRIKKTHPQAQLRGVTIAPQAPDGFDLLVGASRDATFGPVVGFGIGGIYVEAIADVTFALAPLSDQAADRLIDSTHAASILNGARGEQFDRKAVRKALVGISHLITDFPQIAELDLNPLRVSATGAVSLDTRIILTK
jgi:acyl-CoA synthetase (NDP forming)